MITINGKWVTKKCLYNKKENFKKLKKLLFWRFLIGYYTMQKIARKIWTVRRIPFQNGKLLKILNNVISYKVWIYYLPLPLENDTKSSICHHFFHIELFSDLIRKFQKIFKLPCPLNGGRYKPLKVDIKDISKYVWI